jgi:hypothetical protein
MEVFMKNIYILLVGIFGFNSFALAYFDHIGPPSKVHCSATVLLAKEPIKELTDINDLLSGSTREDLETINPECHKFNGKVVGCEAMIETDKLMLRYAFNTQNGNISITDKVTGQSSWHSWTNEHGLTKTGYVTIGGWLTNLKGGLLGNSRAFKIEFSCQAFGKDWE